LKDELAQALLAKVMGWTDDVPMDKFSQVQSLARYKYDGYQRFEPGRHFLESLAVWLEQFAPEERDSALSFVLRRLVFISDAEINHLVEVIYPDFIRPTIRRHAAEELGIPEFMVAKIESSKEFGALHRRSVFLGLSDGARIDRFRRTSRLIDNEQVYPIYEIADERRAAMHEDLLKDLREYSQEKESQSFKLIFLLDDFAGSGRTLISLDDGNYKGRLRRLADLIRRDHQQTPSVFAADAIVYVCLYVATEQAIEHVVGLSQAFTDAPWSGLTVLSPPLLLDNSSRVEPAEEVEFDRVIQAHYDPAIETRHTGTGGVALHYGYADCALPLVLEHNTPNNSLALLWAGSDKLVPLFPRMERHR